jgi:hypothetical protein
MRRGLKIDSEAMGRFMDPGPLSTYVISKKEDKGKNDEDNANGCARLRRDPARLKPSSTN